MIIREEVYVDISGISVKTGFEINDGALKRVSKAISVRVTLYTRTMRRTSRVLYDKVLYYKNRSDHRTLPHGHYKL